MPLPIALSNAILLCICLVLVGCPANDGAASGETASDDAGSLQETAAAPAGAEVTAAEAEKSDGASREAEQNEMTWRPYVDPEMSMEQISSLSKEDAQMRLEELEVQFEPVRFHESIEIDPAELTALMLQAGMHPDVPNHAGVSPLQAASYQQKQEHMEVLLSHGADVNYTDPRFQATPVDFAVGSGNVEVLRRLMEEGADPAGGSDSRRILIDAIESGSAEMFDFIFERFPDISVTDKSGQGCLMNACLVGNRYAVDRLFDAGADVSETEPMGGTPLSAAAFRDNWDLVDFLIGKGADPLASYRGNRNLFFEIAGSYDWPRELAEQLREQGLDFDQVEERSGNSPMTIAARKGNNSFVEWLLENGADPSTVDQSGYSACDYARFTANGELLALFARYGITSDKELPAN